MYQVFLWIHIVSYLVWILAFLISLLFAFMAGRAFQTPAEKRYMQQERKATSIGAHVGAIGILISGGALTSMGSWGWFPFHQFTWLAVMQAIFVVILILVAFSVKQSVVFKKQVRGEGSDLVSKQARIKWKSAYKISLAVYLLVVFNTYLGLARPF